MARPSLPKINWNWLGVMPFFLFALLFLILPASSLFVGSFQDNQGQFTFNNIKNLFTPYILNSYKLTIQVSLVTAVGGALFGFLMAYAVTLGGLPRWLRPEGGEVMAGLLRRGRDATGLREWYAAADAHRDPAAPCSCGSGRAFVSCHGDSPRA